MRCPQCHHQNGETAKFCEECGAKLISACPQCGQQVNPTAKFCPECGTPLTRQSSVQRLGSSVQKEAEECFWKAIEIAQQQQAKSLELRATMSLARLWQQRGKQKDAHQMLAEIYGWFTEGFDTKDLQEAKALSQELGG